MFKYFILFINTYILFCVFLIPMLSKTFKITTHTTYLGITEKRKIADITTIKISIEQNDLINCVHAITVLLFIIYFIMFIIKLIIFIIKKIKKYIISKNNACFIHDNRPIRRNNMYKSKIPAF